MRDVFDLEVGCWVAVRGAVEDCCCHSCGLTMVDG